MFQRRRKEKEKKRGIFPLPFLLPLSPPSSGPHAKSDEKGRQKQTPLPLHTNLVKEQKKKIEKKSPPSPSILPYLIAWKEKYGTIEELRKISHFPIFLFTIYRVIRVL